MPHPDPRARAQSQHAGRRTEAWRERATTAAGPPLPYGEIGPITGKRARASDVDPNSCPTLQDFDCEHLFAENRFPLFRPILQTRRIRAAPRRYQKVIA